MALLRAFERQIEKRICPICRKCVTRGVYQSHLNDCKLESDDDDCCIIAEVHAEDRKSETMGATEEDRVNLNASTDDLFCNPDFEESATEKAISGGNNPEKHILPPNKLENALNGADEKRMAEIVIIEEQKEIRTETMIKNGNEAEITAKFERSTRKRSKKVELSGTKRWKAAQKLDPKRLKSVEEKTDTSRSCETTSMTSKQCSVNETAEKINIKIVTDVHCEPSTSPHTRVERNESLVEILENIKSYLSSCECELSNNMRASANDENYFGDGEKVGSPYYLTLFYKILKRVFCGGGQYGEAQFWNERLRILAKFIALSDRSKQLLIRLFLRKRKWLIADKLSYADISSSLTQLFEELLRAELVDSSRSSLVEIEEAVHLLHAPSLKVVAKHFKLDFNKGKSEICRALLHFAVQKNVFGITMEKRVLHKIKEELGPCFRLRKEVSSLFSAFWTLYSPMDMNTTLLFDQPSINLPSQLLFILLQIGVDKIRFPAPDVPPVIDIYTDADKLFRYIEAKELEAQIAELMQKSAWNEIISCATEARTKFKSAYAAQRRFCESLLGHLRRFTDLHVYARCISHGVEALERLRDYGEAVAWLEYLLYAKEFEHFLCNARGGWWDRLALNLDVHLKDKNRAMKVITDGLEDPALGDKDRLLLQDRGIKLCSKWKRSLEVVQPERVDIKGPILGKNIGESKINRFLIEKNGVSYECSVEEVALDHYVKKKGFKEGIHAEGKLWHTLFGLLFYDIIFDPNIENVWFSETQVNPADLNSRTFYTNRQDLFELRFKDIEEIELNELLLEMEHVYNRHYGVTNSEISWDCFTDFDQIRRFMVCCPISALCAIIHRLVTDYRNCRSGFPDLTVWNDEKKLLAVVEVKGPGDKLSTKQRLWLNFFEKQNIIAHVCHVSGWHPSAVSTTIRVRNAEIRGAEPHFRFHYAAVFVPELWDFS